MADGSVLVHGDELAQVSQRSAHVRAHLVEGCPLHRMLKEVTGEGCVGSEARVASKCRLIVTRVKIRNRRAGGRSTAPGTRRVGVGDVGCMEVL